MLHFYILVCDKGKKRPIREYKGVRPDGYLKIILFSLVYPLKLMCAVPALAILMWVADS